MNKQKVGAVIVILILIGSNVFFALKLSETQKELKKAKTDVEIMQAKLPVIEFNQLFVDRVLRAEGEVNFETRLELENKVRELDDAEILGKWKSFVDAKTQAEAQSQVKDLLGLLAKRMNG